ncbi:hypothetical protein DRE_05993 [Drechslerella stenobrocha 248]|uniref:OPA3-like protein n=1 Tax=Drechslerella stenobrocha 248 TaxID=1043628 RepID=W7HMP8_9PEZI|nr:hypothetical protein DRE_05993 [Drechslerella stenobrocha 248]
MSTIAIKLTSLAIRTLAKPIANSIKQQAHEHPRFRTICISLAQAVHRTDMRIRLGLLRDSSAIAKAEEEEERRKAGEKEKEKGTRESIAKMAADALKGDKSAPTTKTSGSGPGSSAPTPPPSPSSESSSHHLKTHAPKKRHATPHIRPLSDTKAIERGANFISEAFLFSVAGGLILYEAVRSRKKEMNRRDVVAERLQNLEQEDEIWRRKVEMLERRLDAAGIKQVPALLPAEPQQGPPLQPRGWMAKIWATFSQPSSEGDSQPRQAPSNPEATPAKSAKP